MTVRGELKTSAVQVLGSAVLLQGPAVLDAARLVTRALKAGRYDGIEPHPRLLALQRAFEEASGPLSQEMSQPRHATSQQGGSSAESFLIDPIGAKEAAKMLDMSTRQVQRTATQMGAHKLSGGTYVFERGAVLAFAASRTSTPQHRQENP